MTDRDKEEEEAGDVYDCMKILTKTNGLHPATLVAAGLCKDNRHYITFQRMLLPDVNIHKRLTICEGKDLS